MFSILKYKMRVKNLNLFAAVLILLIFSISLLSADFCLDYDDGKIYRATSSVYVENYWHPSGDFIPDHCDLILPNLLNEQWCDGGISGTYKTDQHWCEYIGEGGGKCNEGACYPDWPENPHQLYELATPSSLTFSWTKAEYAYKTYVYLWEGNSMGDITEADESASSTGTSLTIGNLTPETDYTWTIVSKNDAGFSQFYSNGGGGRTQSCPTCADPETVSCGANIPDTAGCDACTEVGRLCPSGYYCTWDADWFGGWGCASWACTVNTEHSYLKCYNGDVYWYDNCNDRDDKYQDCGTGTCSTSGTDHCVACVPTITCPSANAVPCGQDGGTNGCTSCGITGTQCTTGTCTAGVCSCTPDLSCAANTCIGSTCTDPVCGDTVDGAKDCPSCPDGTCNGDETCSSCPADCGVCECEITDGWWDVNMASEGTVVGINVTGNSYCDGETVSFEVREEDLNLWISSNPVDTEPLSSVFSGTKANTTWVAEWHDDLGGPEYWFRATVSTDEFTSSSSIENQLNVSEDEPCSGIQVCNNYSDALTCGEDDCNKSASNAELIAPGIDCAGEDDTCECYWDTTAGSCKINAIDVTISSDGSSGSCSYKELLGNTDCDGTNEFITYSWIADWNGDADAEGFERCIAGSNIIQCPAEIKLPFFGWMQTIAVLVLIVLGYKYLIIKKGKKRKSSKDDSGEPKKKQKK